MKRGLVKFDPDETPLPAYERRLDHVREKLKDAGCNVGLVYADVSRGGDLAYLTNFCLYWNEAVLAVPVEGPPALIMKLSKRVQPWIERTTILEDVRSGPNAAQNIATFLSERTGERPVAGLIDARWWPSTLAHGLAEAAPGADLRPLDNVVKAMRRAPDEEEGALIEQAGAVLARCMSTAEAESDDGARLSRLVGDARREGYADLEAHCRSGQGGARLIDAWGQYRYVWAEAARTSGGRDAAILKEASEAFVAALKPGASEQSAREAMAKDLPNHPGLSASCWSHVDIETRGAFRADDDAARAFASGEIVAPRLTLKTPDGVLAVAATVRITDSGLQTIAA